MSQPFEPIGHLQARVMHLLWEIGPLTVPQIHLAGRGAVLANRWPREVAYTTVLTVVRNLWRRGLLARDERGHGIRCHVYAPTIDRDTYRRQLLEHVAAVYFEDRADLMADLAAAIQAVRLSDAAQQARARAGA